MINIPWDKYGLIAELATRLNTVAPQFGKTSLQKLIYLLHEGYGVDCGYQFELYTYGPFSSDIMIDLDQVEGLKGVSVNPVITGTGGYRIAQGENCENIRKKAIDFLEQNNAIIDKLIMNFGELTAKQLELRSTILFAYKESRTHEEVILDEKLSKIVGEIKPKFSNDEILDAIQELRNISLLK